MQYRRKTHRLTHWDYASSGCYFVTFCTSGKANTLARIDESGDVALSGLGMLCEAERRALLNAHPELSMDGCVIMPNHIHALIHISEGSHGQSLDKAIGAWKAAVTRNVHGRGMSGPVWQTSFHDHIVRNDKDHERLMRYIHENPKRWSLDCLYNPNNPS